MVKRNALGRGLGALIDDAEKIKQARISEIRLDQIEANPFQPRSNFNEEALEELAASIREIGLIQPVTLRKVGEDRYQIIVGERRCRAAQKAGLVSIPAYIRDARDDGMLEMALVENIQREDLNPVEIALSYQRLIDECNYSQENISSRVGKSRPTITNYLRLLKLPAIIQKSLRDREISMGHARAIINIEDEDIQEMICKETIENDYSVRKVEEIVRNLATGNQDNTRNEKKKELPERFKLYKGHLGELLGSGIKIMVNDKGKGKIIIPFKSGNDLERIVKIIENKK